MNIKDKILAEIILKLVSKTKIGSSDFVRYKHFNYWQKEGVNILPNHFYQPIPDIKSLKRVDHIKQLSMNGIDMNVDKQKKLLKSFKKYGREVADINTFKIGIDDQKDPKYYFENLAFDYVDAAIYYSMVRFFKPKNIIEVGSGWSTKIAYRAAIINKITRIISVEPYPQPFLENKLLPNVKLIKKDVQDVPQKYFELLSSNDILFIDSSHTVKTGGDVNYLILEILPKLKKDVIVHIHDIFLPFDYPFDWVTKEFRFWNEQYLIHAFLLFNDTFEVVFANNFMINNYKNDLKKVFPHLPKLSGGSLWIRKTK